MQAKSPESSPQSKATVWAWLSILLYMLVVGGYFLIRYQGRWAEADSGAFTSMIRIFSRVGRIVPGDEYSQVYPNGYAYQAISAFILALTGLEVATLQQLVYPFTAALVVLPAFVLYRELLEDTRKATITTLLLFTQPEFLFVILRSSHEKFTRTLLLLCLFLLVRSFRIRQELALFAAHVGLFYMVAFAFISSNNLLAHSFIFAIYISLGLGLLLRKRIKVAGHDSDLLQRLGYASLICLGLVYLFTFYVYTPAKHDLVVLRNIWERIVVLFLDVQKQSTNSYIQVSGGWVNLQIYFIVSIANWIVLAGSFMIWVGQSWRWVVRRTEQPSQMSWLLWLFYTSFALQGVISAVADASGSIGNLQHRLFPSFSIMAVAVVGSRLAQWRPRRFARSLRLGLTMGIAVIAILSVLKATNEPALSNKWTFYREHELMALAWADLHLKNAEIRTEFDERLGIAFFTNRGSLKNASELYADDLRIATRNVLITDITRLRGRRLGRALPMPPDSLQVYDSGAAQLYHLRPESPYQR